MGKGIDLARGDAPIHTKVLDDFKDQLLIVMAKRLGGDVSIPVAEVDDTGHDLLSFSVNDGVFQFIVSKKS
jgi:hypothetical protein